MNKTQINEKERRWILKAIETEESRAESAKIAEKLKIHPIIARLLYSRGYTDEKSMREFIGMESEMLCNPFELTDMDKAVDRIHKAILNHERITVFGDYDVDGVTSVCTLYLYFKSKGADIDYYIPNRVGEGYGVSNPAIDLIKERGTSLIVTVDTGTTANEEIEYARSVGVDFVVTDHHECRSDLPNAVAVVNPHRPDCDYPFKELAGVGVVFKLISAYEERIVGKRRIDAALTVFREYADLVAIGTIADVMPIKSENRIIVSYGLKMIEDKPRHGITALAEANVSGSDSHKNVQKRSKRRTKITSSYIGYTLAPRINAAGRIRTAEIAVKLFLAESEAEAAEIAEQLCEANKERQNEENRIMTEAFAKIEEMELDKSPVIVLSADTWHHGVIGIVASRITEKYSRPSILVSFEGNTDSENPDEHIGKGSGRSIKGMNLVDALCYCSENLVKFGGHELAAGLSVTRGQLDSFIKGINEYAKSNLTSEDMIPTFDADAVIDFDEVNLTVAGQLQHLEPYGVGNPTPAFIIKGLYVNEVSSISDGKHTKFILGNGYHNVTAIYFSNSPESIGIHVGDKVDVLANIDINEWQGRRSVQLIIKDIRQLASEAELIAAEKDRFAEIWNGDSYSAEENVCPTREDFVAVYRLMSNYFRIGINTLSHRAILSKLSKVPGTPEINYIKLKIIIKVLTELNILGIEEIDTELYKFSVKFYSQKTNLEKSNLLKRIRNQQRKG